MRESNGKFEPAGIDPAQTVKLLEVELLQKRAAWQRTKARNNSLRILSYLFLMVVIAGAAAAYFFLIPGR